MIVLNEFILKNQDKMKHFIRKIASVPADVTIQKPKNKKEVNEIFN